MNLTRPQNENNSHNNLVGNWNQIGNPLVVNWNQNADNLLQLFQNNRQNDQNQNLGKIEFLYLIRIIIMV